MIDRVWARYQDRPWPAGGGWNLVPGTCGRGESGEDGAVRGRLRMAETCRIRDRPSPMTEEAPRFKCRQGIPRETDQKARSSVGGATAGCTAIPGQR